jgi:predicted metal-dependent HD superfamily phosphohydrolase
MLIMMDNELPYHNWEHVASMYQYLADTNEPYCESLDYAVLFHDIVYDALPNKERRSFEMLKAMANDPEENHYFKTPINYALVEQLIMATETHNVSADDIPQVSAIVRADLHGLTDPLTTAQNFSNILTESIGLYSCSMDEYYAATDDFMKGLAGRVFYSAILDFKHEQFYSDVLDGIDLTCRLAAAMISK